MRVASLLIGTFCGSTLVGTLIFSLAACKTPRSCVPGMRAGDLAKCTNCYGINGGDNYLTKTGQCKEVSCAEWRPCGLAQTLHAARPPSCMLLLRQQGVPFQAGWPGTGVEILCVGTSKAGKKATAGLLFAMAGKNGMPHRLHAILAQVPLGHCCNSLLTTPLYLPAGAVHRGHLQCLR